MKKIIFDVDGVLLSEERYFDVSALTVWEWLYSPAYMGFPSERNDFDPLAVTDGQIAAIRSEVWGEDRLLSWLKERGINSNWDMVHADLVTILWLMEEEYRRRTGESLPLSFETEEDVKNAGLHLMGIPVPKAGAVLARWEKAVPEGIMGEAVFQTLEHAMEKDLGRPVPWVSLRSSFWRLHMEAFQEWYLGDDVFIQAFGKTPYSGGKEGFLRREVPLAPADAVRALFARLKGKGWAIAVATGRARLEVEIPFRQFRWLDEFDPFYIATASDAADAALLCPGASLDKPHPFTYECAFFGRDRNRYKEYAEGTLRPGRGDEAVVVGDSLSDVMGARAAGMDIIGVLTGLTGAAAAAMFERENALYVPRVTDIERILDGKEK